MIYCVVCLLVNLFPCKNGRIYWNSFGGVFLVAVFNTTPLCASPDYMNRRYITALKEIAHKIKPKFNIQNFHSCNRTSSTPPWLESSVISSATDVIVYFMTWLPERRLWEGGRGGLCTWIWSWNWAGRGFMWHRPCHTTLFITDYNG
jgi:hypothetical protein